MFRVSDKGDGIGDSDTIEGVGEIVRGRWADHFVFSLATAAFPFSFLGLIFSDLS